MENSTEILVFLLNLNSYILTLQCISASSNLIYGKTICPNKFLQIFFLRFKEEVGKYFNI